MMFLSPRFRRCRVASALRALARVDALDTFAKSWRMERLGERLEPRLAKLRSET